MKVLWSVLLLFVVALLVGSLTFAGSVRLKGTRAKLPPGLLQSGNTYLVSLAASANGGIDLESRPFTNAGAYDAAETILGQLTP